ncbi:MAG: mechanosensitive ion channel family protein [Ilumatobacteraceae bacterium]
MTEGWISTMLLVFLVPLLVIATSELDERLRQRDSPLRRPLSAVRLWVLPVFALWAITRLVLDLDPDHFIAVALATLLVIGLAIAATRLLAVGVDSIRGRPRADGRGPVPQLMLALPRILLLLVIGWLLLGVVWGVDLSAALTALGVTSLVVSFALQDTLSGLASGFLLLSDQPFEPGNWICADDTEGLVVDINWRTTLLRTRNGDLTVVPNSVLAKATIVNYSKPAPLHRVVYPVQVAFSNPPTLAKDMLLDAAAATPNVLQDPPPRVRVVQTDDPLMGYEVDLWVADYAVVPQVSSDFGSLIWYQSHRHDVPLPSPAQDLYLHDAVTAAESARPDPVAIRRGLQQSGLLAMLGDDDLDRLVPATRRVRFAAGELLSDGNGDRRDLMVVTEGLATMVLIDPAVGETAIDEITQGELVGVTEARRTDGRSVAVRAVTDCDVLIIAADAASEIGSRNSELAAALNRLGAMRRRRLDRIIEQRNVAAVHEPSETAADKGAS